ncbi:MAG: hypothetical protein HOC71_12895 [Candidatus Latescibacteria bacterium]|nr:hypothetical protein [Candidatus Latescibacterota bacterium]
MNPHWYQLSGINAFIRSHNVPRAIPFRFGHQDYQFAILPNRAFPPFEVHFRVVSYRADKLNLN